MSNAPTWIDAGLASEWQYGHPARYDFTGRWFIGLNESCAAFVVMSGNASHGSFGGEDAHYTAEEIASAIERWGTPVAGLVTCLEFIEALERHAKRASATGTRLEAIRAKYLLGAMRARVAIAQTEDALSFAAYASRQPADDHDGGSEGAIPVAPCGVSS